MPRRARRAILASPLVGGLALVGLAGTACSPAKRGPAPSASVTAAPPSASAPLPSGPSRPSQPSAIASVDTAPAKPTRARIDGRAFPRKVLALTWDDGPDDGTVELARYLHDQHVVATFFVVEAWVPGVSNEPGEGAHVFATGYDALDVLGELVHLGHRVANHTKNHVLLGDAPAAVVVAQLGENQRGIDRFVPPDLRLFRAPGGAWSDAASLAIDADPSTARLVGPVHWDIDGKDWEGSLYCTQERRASECELGAPGGGFRLKPEVVADRYVALARDAGRGIVLFHDRVGHVGSDYARRLARLVVPALKAEGFVFAAPVLRFGEPRPSVGHAPKAFDPSSIKVDLGAVFGEHVDATLARAGDVNGDGLVDLCAPTRAGVACALSDGHRYLESSVWLAGDPGRFELVDTNGDGRADLCVARDAGAECALAP